MKQIIIYILILIPIITSFAQQNLYVKNNETGRMKKLNKKSILTFEISDSTVVTGRIVTVTDSSFVVSTYEKSLKSGEFNLQIKSVIQVTNKLINKKGLASTSYFIGCIGIIGLVTSPFLLISDTPEDALGLLEVSAVLVGVGGVLYSPYLIKRKFNTNNDWTLVAK